MQYCDIHKCNNCLLCALEKQTSELVESINRLAEKQCKCLICRVIEKIKKLAR